MHTTLDRHARVSWVCRWGDVPRLIGVAVAYAVLAKIVLTLYSTSGLVATFWPGAGVALAAVVLGGRIYAGGIFLGALAAQLWMGQTAGAALVIALASALEPLLGAWLLLAQGDFDKSLRSVRDFFRLFVLAGALSPFLGAVIGVGALLLFGRIGADDFPRDLAFWWMGNALGIVVVAPIVMVWRRPPRWRQWHSPEVMVLLTLSFMLGQIIFLDWFHDIFGLFSHGYWLYLVVSWAAVRLGLHGVLLIILVAIVQALDGAARGIGYFGSDLAETQLFNFWAYVATLSMVGMSLASVFAERERAVANLHESEERFLLAKNAAGLGIYDKDLISGRLEWDDRAREMWGVAAEEPLSYATFMAGVHPDDRAEMIAIIDRALVPVAGRDCRDYRIDFRVIGRCDRSLRQIAAHGRTYFADGRAVRLVGTVSDVTAQKQLEKDARERRSEMELLVNKQVAVQTAAAIAHELNQPLVSISAYSEAALRMLRSGSKSPDKLLRALEGAMQQAQRAGQTLHQLLDFLHEGEAVVEAVDLNDAVCEAIAIAAEGGYDGFTPVVGLGWDLAPVLANRLQLQKVLVNLLHNSVEAMRDAGMPSPRIAITVRTLSGRNMAQVTVKDSGPGFDDEVAKSVFEPFFSTKPKGMGLGLAISRALIESHGGQLWAESGAGRGATFHFILPFAT